MTKRNYVTRRWQHIRIGAREDRRPHSGGAQREANLQKAVQAYKSADAQATAAPDAVNLGFALVPKPGSMQSPRNAFVKTNWNNGSILWNEDKCEWALCPERLLVAYGPRHIDGSITASVDNGKLHISCTNPRLKERNAVDDDQLMVAVYRPAIPTMHLYEGPLRKECGECDFMLPTDTSGEDDVMHVYAWFQATLYHRAGGGKDTVRPNQASPSVYLGGFHL